MSEATAKTIIVKLYQTYTKRIDEAYQLYVDEAMKYDESDLNNSINSIIMQSKWFPRWAEIVEKMPKKVSSETKLAQYRIDDSISEDIKMAKIESRVRSEMAKIALEELDKRGINQEDIQKYIDKYLIEIGLQSCAHMFEVFRGPMRELALADLYRSGMNSQSALLLARTCGGKSDL